LADEQPFAVDVARRSALLVRSIVGVPAGRERVSSRTGPPGVEDLRVGA
jgi:hypothetical protein